MVLDMCFNKDQSYLYSASVDMKARSWLPEVGGDAKIFEGATRSITLVYIKGAICESAYFHRENAHNYYYEWCAELKDI